MKRKRHLRGEEAELDITAFLNLMIVLVPILLLGMVFSQITVIDVTLPAGSDASAETPADREVEIVIREEGMRVNFPRGVMLKEIPRDAQGEQDFALLGLVLQEVKRQLREQGLDKRSITLLSEESVDYQTIVTAMDTVRSYKAIVAASVVDAVLFPEISFGDAPEREDEGEA